MTTKLTVVMVQSMDAAGITRFHYIENVEANNMRLIRSIMDDEGLNDYKIMQTHNLTLNIIQQTPKTT